MSILVKQKKRLSDSDSKVQKILDKRAPPVSDKDQTHNLRFLAENSCPNEYNSYFRCFSANSKDYKNCLPETKKMLFCTGSFLARVNAAQVLEKVVEALWHFSLH